MGKSYNEYRIMAYEDSFGYPAEWVYKEFETKAELKSYLRHFYKENRKYLENGWPITLRAEVRINDEDYGPQDEWSDLSSYWSFREMEEKELWCERKGIDPGKVFGWYDDEELPFN